MLQAFCTPTTRAPGGQKASAAHNVLQTLMLDVQFLLARESQGQLTLANLEVVSRDLDILRQILSGRPLATERVGRASTASADSSTPPSRDTSDAPRVRKRRSRAAASTPNKAARVSGEAATNQAGEGATVQAGQADGPHGSHYRSDVKGVTWRAYGRYWRVTWVEEGVQRERRFTEAQHTVKGAKQRAIALRLKTNAAEAEKLAAKRMFGATSRKKKVPPGTREAPVFDWGSSKDNSGAPSPATTLRAVGLDEVSLPRVVGVLRKRNSFNATWVEGASKRSKSFAIKEFGVEGAHGRAAQYRADRLAEMKAAAAAANQVASATVAAVTNEDGTSDITSDSAAMQCEISRSEVGSLEQSAQPNAVKAMLIRDDDAHSWDVEWWDANGEKGCKTFSVSWYAECGHADEAANRRNGFELAAWRDAKKCFDAVKSEEID